jgi:hypothetical protein
MKLNRDSITFIMIVTIMRAFFLYACTALLLLGSPSSNANATPLSLRTVSPPPTQIIYQLPNEKLLENLAIRQTGQILVSPQRSRALAGYARPKKFPARLEREY